MPTWKKVVVSGSAISQLNNDANYITSAGAPVQSVSGQTGAVTTTQILAGSTVLSGSFPTAPVTSVAGQTGVVTQAQIFAGSGALSGSDSMTIAGNSVALGGSITADTIAGAISNDTITNAQLANEGMTIAGQTVNLGGSVSQAQILNGSTVLSGSFPTAPVTSVAGQTGVVTQAQIFAGSGALSGSDSMTIAGNTVALGGSITADTIAGAISNDTITNAQLANESMTIAGNTVNLGGSVSQAQILGGSTVLSGSFPTAPVTSVAGQTGVVTQAQIFAGSGALSGSDSMTIAGNSVALGGSITADTIAGAISNDTITNAQLANESMTIAGNTVNLGGSVSQAQILGGSTVLSGSFPTAPVQSVSGQTGNVTTTQILAGSTVLSGSFPTAFISSVNDTSGQDGIDLTVNAGVLSAVASGLGTSDNVEFANLTVSGDLSVAGTASFKNATNLNVADQYISMNSGSAGAANDSGGIVVLQDGPNGELFGWADAAVGSGTGGQRWGVKTNFNPSSTGNFDPDAYMAAVLKGQDNVNTAADIAGIDSVYNRKGNIYVSSNAQDIWIYS